LQNLSEPSVGGSESPVLTAFMDGFSYANWVAALLSFIGAIASMVRVSAK
jgi:hypothetical protein